MDGIASDKSALQAPGTDARNAITLAEPSELDAEPVVLPLVLPQRRQLEALAARRAALVEQALAPNTRRAYAQCWRQYTRFCAAYRLDATDPDPDQVALFLCALDSPSASRVQQLVAAIRWQLDRLGHPLDRSRDGDLRRVARALARQDAARHRRRVRPVGRQDLARILAGFADTPADHRDRAILVLGYAGALRRAELAALDLADLEMTRDDAGVVLTLRTSKTDPEGRGHRLRIGTDSDGALDLCGALRAWMAVRGAARGPLFQQIRRGGHLTGRRLSGHAVARLLKARAATAGLAAAAISGHALRAGWVTDADAAGMSLGRIVQHSRHRDPGSVMAYIRPPAA